MTWQFDQEPNVVAITCKTVMANAPVLLVTHYLDDHSWAFLDGQIWEPSEALLVTMKSVIDAHPYLDELADLPPGWSATRQDAASPWVRGVDPVEHDD